MSEENKKSKKRPPEVRKKRRRRFFLGSFWVTFGILIVLGILLNLYGSKLLKNFIVNTVEFQSNGLYQVEFGNVDVHFLKQGFEIENFHLIPNRELYKELKVKGEVRRGLYDIRIPHFAMKGLNLTPAFYQNSFVIDHLDISEPEIQLIDIPIFGKAKDYKEGYDDIKPVIQELVEFFKVKDLGIKEGIFDIFLEREGETKTFTASRISLRLKDFQVDKKTKSGQDKFLYSEGAEIRFRDYKLFLKDNIHVAEANEIGINTIDSVVYARGFSLNPSQMSKSELRKSGKSYFSAFLPEIALQGADIIKAYEQDTFQIRDLMILRPKIVYSNQTPLSERIRSNKTLKNQVDIYPLIKGYFNLLEIEDFRLEEGNFSYKEPLETVPENIDIKGIGVVLSDFSIDSTSFLKRDRILYASDLKLDFNSFRMSLRDSVHVLEAKSLLISSDDNMLKASGLKIHPGISFDTKRKNDLLYIELPEVLLNNVDLYKMYFDGKLNADLLDVISPNVRIENKRRNKKDTADIKTAGDIYQLFSKYLSASEIDTVRLRDGAIDYRQTIQDRNEEIIAENIFLTLYNFKLDSVKFVDRENFLFSEHVDFELKDYDFILPNEINEITVGNFRFSSRNNKVFIDNTHMRITETDRIYEKLVEKDKSGYLEFDIPSIRLDRADIFKALNDNMIDIGAIQVNEPILKRFQYDGLKKEQELPPSVSELRDIVKGILPSVLIEKLYVNFGKIINIRVDEKAQKLSFQNQLNIEFEDISLEEDTASTTKKKLFFSDKLKAVFWDQEMYLNDNIHSINSDTTIIIYPESKVIIQNFVLNPDTTKLKDFSKSHYFRASAPYAEFGDVDIDHFYDNQVLRMGKGWFDTILVDIYASPYFKGPDSLKSGPFAMPKILNELYLSDLEFKHGKFRYFDEEQNLIADGSFEGTIMRSMINDLTVGENGTEMPLEDFSLLFPEINYRLVDDSYLLSIDSLYFNLGDNSITSSGLSFVNQGDIKSQNSSSAIQLVEFTLDSLVITDFDFEKYFLEQKLDIDVIEFQNPELELLRLKKPEKKPELHKVDIFPMIKEFFREAEIGELLLSNGDIEIYDSKPDSNELYLSLEKVYIDFKDIFIDSLAFLDEDRLMYSKDVVFRIKDYSREFPEAMMSINFDEIGLSTGTSSIYANGMHLKPYHDEYNFSRLLGYQADRIDMKLNRLELGDVDLFKLYNEEVLYGGGLKIDSFFVDDYRDKRVPNKEDARPPMFHELVRSVPIPFRFDSVVVKNGNARYQEFAPDGEKPGEVFFSDIKSIMYWVSNDPGYYAFNPPSYLFAVGKLMDQGDIIMSGNFYFMDTSNAFNIQGSMGVMDMTAINPMLENVAFVSIKSGVARSIDFSFEADDDYAEGEFSFRYSKFKIFVVNRKTGEAEGLDEGIVSWLANTFLINTNNPHLGFFKDGEIYFRRDKSKSIVNYVWKSIFSGIKTSIGAQTQKKLHRIAEKEEKASRKNK